MLDYNSLARSYNILDSRYSLQETLESYFSEKSFCHLSKRELHEFINLVLQRNYDGEEILKYSLTNYFIKKKVTAAFEVKILDSRADFIAINGDSKSFEVKSDLDNLNRLKKQSYDYSKVFEYNYAVTGQKHLERLEEKLPEYYGIWTFKRNKVKPVIYRTAQKSPNIDKLKQLELFTKKEKIRCFASSEHSKILETNTAETINLSLKKTLKNRYNTRWTFLKKNYQDIYPLNIQFFFNKNLKPEIIYDSF